MLLVGYGIQAQTHKKSTTDTPVPQKNMVLYEEFTSATCGPCAATNEPFDRGLKPYYDRTVSIKYHGWFPAPFNRDPMYVADSTDILYRFHLYGVNAEPTIFVNGKVYAPYTVALSLMEKLHNQTVPINLNVSYDLSPTKDTVHVKCSLYANQDFPRNNLRLFVSATEKEVIYATPPGTNGEKEFAFPQRKALPDMNGIKLPANITQGYTLDTTITWVIPADLFQNVNNLGIAAFIQDMDSLIVHQSAYAEPIPQETVKVSIVDVRNMPASSCDPNFSATVRFMNLGSDTLTSAKLHISVNGSEQVTNWTGVLPYFEYAEINTASFTNFTQHYPSNAIKAWFTDLNAVSNNSDTAITSYKNPDTANSALTLTLRTDEKPQEITWNIKDGNGTIVQQGGPYVDSLSTKRFNMTLPKGCYTITFYDAGKDGICCAHGRGYAKLDTRYTSSTKTLFTSEYTDSIFTYSFTVLDSQIVAISDVQPVVAKAVVFSPNPSNGLIQVNTNMDIYDCILRVYDESGKKVLELKEKTLTNGKILNLTNLPKGMYFIQISNTNLNETSKIIIH